MRLDNSYTASAKLNGRPWASNVDGRRSWGGPVSGLLTGWEVASIVGADSNDVSMPVSGSVRVYSGVLQ